MKEKSLLFTYSVVFFVMIIWGLNVVMLKLLVEQFPPATMTAFRIMTAGVVTIGIVLLSKKMKKMTKKQWYYTAMGTLFGVVGHHTFLAQGLTLTNASNAVLILALLPLTTFLFAVIFLGDRLTKWRLFGVGLAFIGVMFIQGGGGNWSVQLGELYVFIAMVVQAISFIYIKKVTQTLDSKQVTALMLVIGSAGLLVISFIMEPASVGQMVGAPFFMYVVFFVSAIIATALGHFLFNAAIQRIGAGQTAIFNNFVPFFGLVSSALFLGEQIYWYQSLGFVIIVLGVLFGTGYAERTWFKTNIIHQKSM
ncbi:DMT family transporter [Halalkalibacter nanhaiisediminis]|uniref:EamA domain-containing membrane protein RarD n=1 Tax=Halalkalibacter nanhaiisediminis TaxID=688079 RepID=A0A562QQC0_9BACI|nr:DMT family transporter [Halalkalibacter nanhaiisediminis]TWI58948.1 EamA domain-containing membrane protein RarD [Halalkalibacter nanhaiisediminis]